MATDKPTVEGADDKLREWLPQGSTVFTILRHVSRSGMRREIALYAITDGEPLWITAYAATVLDRRIGANEGIITDGAGMDMGFDLVYNLSRKLYGDGYALSHRWL